MHVGTTTAVTRRLALFVVAAMLVLAGCTDNAGNRQEAGSVSDRNGGIAGNGGNGANAAGEGGAAAEGETSGGQTGTTGGVGTTLEGKLQLDGKDVKVNQLGYLPEAGKIAVLEGEADAALFQVVDAATKTVVFEGIPGQPSIDPNSGERVRHLDFSGLTQSGEYAVVVPGTGASLAFRIGEDVYDRAFFDALRSYTLGRSGVAIDDPVTGLKHDAGHLQDATAQLDIDHPHAKRGAVVDVAGGWYDAGDYGKYTTPGAVSAAQLLLAYELNPERFAEGQLQFPAGLEGGLPGLPDVLAEVKYELDWLLKMQRPDGAVYHKVSGLQWPGMIKPEDDTQPRYVFGMSTYGTGMFAGAMAMGARVFEPFDEAYAAELLEAAKLAQRYLENNPDVQFLTSERQDGGSGAYGDSGDMDDRFWAAAELFKTTGDAAYAAYIEERFEYPLGQPPVIIGWGSSLALGQFAYATAEGADEAVKAKLKEGFAKAADDIVGRVGRDGYRYALSANEYTWASAKNGMAKAQLLLLASELEPKDAYVQAALEQVHYTFGRNALGTTYLTGAGAVMPQRPHNRIIEGTGTYVPGLLVGGPNRYGGDPVLDRMLKLEEPAPAKAYLDVLDSYSSNEYAIDYNAPLVFALSYYATPETE